MTAHNRQKVWFVTGASRGFGRVWTSAALRRGDRVAATARDVSALADLVEQYPDSLLPLALDVVDRAAVFQAVERATSHFGRIDVVIGNAGFGLFGAIEETEETAARRQIDVNLFGNFWLLKAVAPVLRGQGGGHVLLTSSFGGLVSFATAGLYGASKYALEGLGESFALEMQDFGVKVTLVEPGAYATDFNGPSAEQADQLAAYDPARERTAHAFAALPPGDPEHTAAAILHVVDLADPPLRIVLGGDALTFVLNAYDQRIEQWQAFSSLTRAAQ